MKHRIPRGIKILVSLIFLSMILIMSQMIRPHLIILGVFFVDGIEAALLYSLLLVGMLLLLYFVTKRYRKAYFPLLVFYAAIGFNSFLNMVASVFFNRDLMGFIARVFESQHYFGAYVLNQFLVFLISALVMLYAWSNRPSLDRR